LIIDPENFLNRWVSVLEMSIPRTRGLLIGTKALAQHHSAGAVADQLILSDFPSATLLLLGNAGIVTNPMHKGQVRSGCSLEPHIAEVGPTTVQ
jgi:hypothetical protein